MRLELTNFKCHRSKVVEIPDKGLILLNGDSGVGKSTILSALTYALFGNLTKTRTPYTHGTKSTTVKLEIGDLTITRKCPNKALLVSRRPRSGGEEELYEGDHAQEIIEQYLQGLNYDAFMASSYIVQNQATSILTMTPTEQYKFIQRIAFESESEIEETRAKIKMVLETLKKDVDERKYSLKHLSSQLQRMRDTLPPKRTNPMNFDIFALEKEITELDGKFEKISKKVNVNNSNIETSRKIESDSQRLMRELETLEIELSNSPTQKLESDMANLTELISGAEEEIKKYTTIINFQKEKKMCTENYEKFVKHKQDHNASIEQEIEECKAELEAMQPSALFRTFDNNKKQYEKVVTLRNLYSKFVKNDDEIAKILDELDVTSPAVDGAGADHVDKYLDELIVQYRNFIRISNEPSYECPCCHTDLFMYENALTKTEELKNYINPTVCDHALKIVSEKSKILKALLRTRSFLNEELGSTGLTYEELGRLCTPENIEKCKSEYEFFQAEWNKAFELQARIKELNSSLNDGVFAKMRDSILKDMRDLELREEADPSLRENVFDKFETKRMELAEYFLQKDNISRSLQEYPKKVAKKNAISEELEKRRGSYKSSDEYVELSKKYNEEFMATSAMLKEKRKLYESSKEYIQYEKAMAEVTNVEHLIEDENHFINESMYNIEGYTLFSKLCKDAEIIALEKTIDAINTHASEYISQMFVDPITVKLSTFKENTSKFQLSTYIEYKGSVYTSIDDLSGGERQRCELAYILALNDVLGSKILFLDECLNNLDATVNTDVLTFLRDHTSDKCILVVSHEAVRGLFDEEILV